MAQAEATGATSAELEEPPKDVADLAKKWCAEIKAAEKAQAKWVERSRKIEKIYADERDASSARARKFNILYSNVETLRPAVYMQTPKCKAVRRYRDRDPVARLASMMLERCVQTSCELYDFDAAMDQAVRDRLLPGRGVLWVRYEPGIVGEGANAALGYENAEGSYVPWQDFLHSVARTWEEVRWVARRFFKTRREMEKWLVEAGLAEDESAAKAKAKTIQLDYTSDGKEKNDEGLDDERGKAQVWEVHDKESGKVIYVAPGSNDYAIVGMKPPAVSFRDFFPTPRPLLAATTAKSLIPTPDYAQYQDQAEELNRITDRIGALQKALKVAGYYDSSSAELAKLIEAPDGAMIAVSNWAMFQEGGGGKGKIGFFPVEIVAEVLKGLYEIRGQAKQALYEVSGIGDILRGATDPDETATAQGIKAKWGSLRVRRIQKDVQRYAADILRLKAEVIAEQFSDQTILKMAGVDQDLLAKYVPAPPMPELPPELAQNQQAQAMLKQQADAAHKKAVADFLRQVFALLRDDTARNFRIDVESDSTLEPDQQEEKQLAVEFMTGMTAFMEKAAPMAMQGPEAAKMVGEILLFGVRRFDKVDQLEQVIEQAVEAAAKPKPPQPGPEMMKVQAQIEGKKAELQMKGEAQKQELGMKREAHQLEMGARVQEVQLEAGVKQMEAQQRAQEGQQKLQLQAAQGQQQLRQSALEGQQALRQGEQQGALKQKQGEQQMDIAERKSKMQRDVKDGSPP